jgi:hypothetical protein
MNVRRHPRFLGDAVLVSFALLAMAGVASAGELEMRPLHIAYIEASTGSRWMLTELPQRLDWPDLTVEFHAVYDFDKSSAVREVIESETDSSRVVILQECSVYFPGDMASYRARYTRWIEELLESGRQPVVATTVPPAADMGTAQNFKNFIKARVLGRESQFEQVMAFNDWLRALAQERDLPIFDLEELLRSSTADRHLAPRFDVGDGIHLNAEAYRILDQTFGRLLLELD